MSSIDSELVTKALLTLLEETFEKVQGIYLDKNTTLFDTLAGITAAEASIPVGGQCATLAAQVKHVIFYLDVVEQAVRQKQFTRVDWDEIWRTVSSVTPEEWQAAQADLRQSYQRIVQLVKDTAWSNELEIGGAIGLVAHTAYHLGEIRQALCTIQS